MPLVDTALAKIPQPYRDIAVRHRELVKFAFVGGITFVVDTATFYLLKSTLLAPKPVTAKIVAVTVATVVGYVLNRSWSFRTRGGRMPTHEAVLYFAISAVGLVLNAAPLWLSRYGLHLQVPNVSRTTMEVGDFVSAQIVGTLVAMVFRWWAFRRFVFPDADARARVAAPLPTPPPDPALLPDAPDPAGHASHASHASQAGQAGQAGHDAPGAEPARPHGGDQAAASPEGSPRPHRRAS